MSVDKEVSSEREKKSYFCKVCQVACLNKDGLHSHYKDEEHKKMEEAYCGQKYGKPVYSCLQDYISSPMRKEPHIGLQYIIQLYPEVDCKDAFKCTLCKVIGPLYFIMKHIESFKHRRIYLSVAYKHLLPLFTKRQPFFLKSLAVREHAFKVEEQERTLPENDFKSCSSRIGVKSDFWRYNIKRQEKLEEYNKKLSAYKTQKHNVLEYIETFLITSPEEAALVKNLTEELKAAVNVFNLNAKPKHEKSYKHRLQSTEGSGKYSDFYHSKRRSIWYDKEHKPSSSSLCNEEVQSILEKPSATEEGGRTRKRSRSASKDMLLRVTFSTGSENEAKNANPKEEPQESLAACPVTEQFVSSGHLRESTVAMWHNPNVNTDLFQEIRTKRIRKHSTDVAKWESLFASHRPEMSPSIFSWGPKSPSSNNTEVFPSVEKKENARRASLDALSTFTLFSQEGHEPGLASCQPSSSTFSSFQSPGFKSYKGIVFQDKSPQHKPKQVGDKDQELPCSSNIVCNEAGTANYEVMHTEPGQHNCKLISRVTKSPQNSEAENSCHQLSDVNVAQAPKTSCVIDASSKYSDFKACGSGHLDTKTDSQDADPNVLINTLPSGKLHASGRQLSPEVLQLFKGKDTNSIVHILKTLSPFYPALQELDLEAFAKVLSKTGTITE